MYKETARAKINLNLHVGSRVDDQDHRYFGYHPLSSLVVFANYGDELSCEKATETSLKISGPFSAGLESGAENLILKAYEMASDRAELPPLAFHLVKNLPIASGIGGGSADAAAALRLMQNYVDLPQHIWLDIALALGADVPVCFHSRSCVMSGIGEKIRFQPDFETLPAILVNPGKKVSTGAIFNLFDEDDSLDIARAKCPLKNDLQAPAIRLLGDIQQCLEALGTQPACLIQNMSGSGATCFGVFADKANAQLAVKALKRDYPYWWVQPVMLGDPS